MRPFSAALFLTFLWGNMLLWAETPVLLGTNTKRVVLSSYMGILEDPGGKLRLEDLLSGSQDKRFFTSSDETPNFGYSTSVYWVRFKVDYSAFPQGEWFLEYAFPQMDHLTFYEEGDKGEWKRRATGLLPSFSSREIPHQNYVFTLLPSPDKKVKTYYLRLDNRDQVQIPLLLWSKKEFISSDRKSQFFFGIYFGIFLVMIFYNFFLFLSIRDRSYIYYVAFILCFALWMYSLGGFARTNHSGFFDLFPSLNHHMPLILAMVLLSGAEFTRSFLNTGEILRLGDRTLCALQVMVIGALGLWPLIGYQNAISAQVFLALLIITVIFVNAVMAVLKGSRPARFFFLAWFSLLLGGAFSGLSTYGIVPVNFLTQYSLNFSSVIEVTLLSFALADRINRLREEKLQAQKETMTAQEDLVRAAEEKLFRDPMTGLPNRNRLFQMLDGEEDPAIVVGNVDRFREINNFYGSAIGDYIIRTLTQRLADYCVKENMHLFKFRGDEFAILIPKSPGENALRRVAEGLHDLCEKNPFPYHEHSIEIDVTLGVAFGKDRLIERADTAMKAAKEKKVNFLLYQATMEGPREYEKNLIWARTIKDAIRDNRVTCYFQPILNNHSRQIEKYETLVRLQGTDGKIIAPGLFLPIAKKTKLYGGISKRVIEKSFEALLASDMEFSINLSADDILNDETTAFLFATLKNCAGSSGACSRLVFEILESEGIESYEIVSDFIRKVKVFGCKVAIDDFGTGYSNFEHLLRLQVDYIKIDASLIRTLDSDRNSQILVENIVDFSNKLGILTIAEFVHSQSVLEKVRELGVHFSQGYHIGEPKAHLVV